jgi:hypothetical protein
MTDFDHFLGTRPVSGQHAFDLVALSNWLSNNLPGFIGPLTVEMFKGGQSNPTYKLATPAQSYVMRAKPGPAREAGAGCQVAAICTRGRKGVCSHAWITGHGCSGSSHALPV